MSYLDKNYLVETSSNENGFFDSLTDVIEDDHNQDLAA